MKRLPTITFGLTFVLAWMMAVAHEVKPIEWNFDKDPVGQAPPGWKIVFPVPSDGKSAWSVAADPTAPSPPNVFSLKTPAADDSAFNLAMVEKASMGNLELSVKLRADGGKTDQGGGLVWRCKDEKNYYVCRINPLEGNIRLYKVIDGKRTQLQSAEVNTVAGKWYTLRVIMTDNQISCYVDGKTLLQWTDGSLKEPGTVGLWTKADAATSFDNLMAAAADHPNDQ